MTGRATPYRVRKIVACGSRSWTSARTIRSVLSLHLPRDLTADEPEVIHGDASGADKLIAEQALDLGFWVRAMPADWKTHGKAAGPIRNRAMLDEQPDLVIAFWDGKSRGTKDTIDEARRRGLTCHVVEMAV